MSTWKVDAKAALKRKGGAKSPHTKRGHNHASHVDQPSVMMTPNDKGVDALMPNEDVSTTSKEKGGGKRRIKRRKQAPREVSSKRPVPMGRDDCMNQCPETKARFDPRYEEHCGELREEHVDRNYAFVDGMLAGERAAHAKAKDENALAVVDGLMARRADGRRRREVAAAARASEKQAVRDGKTPFFMRRSALKERELEVKFDELKKTGGVKKFIRNRRRRAAAKERRRMPLHD